MLPYSGNNYKLYFGMTTHAIIYSKEYRNKTLLVKQENIKDWDEYTGDYNLNKYIYKEPLCYQLFPKTENSKYWDAPTKLYRVFLNLIKLDIKPEPGYTIIYLLSKFSILLFFLIIYIIYKKYISKVNE
jgi:hypothetical protein